VKTILVIEDERDILFALREILQAQGYQVASACNGLEALEWLKRSAIPDLILLDMKMPVMNGWQFAEELRRRRSTNIPLIVMTAAADAERRAREVHAVGWIGKPFVVSELLEKIRNHVSAAA
jgi:CheY-like chemotaxis protein